MVCKWWFGACTKWVPVVVTLALVCGCQSKTPTQKEQALKRWNGARAGVLGAMAQTQYENGNFGKSRDALNEALRMDPQNATLRVLSAKLYIEAGELEAAERELQVAQTSDPKNAEADYYSGVIYQRWQKPKEANECYHRAVEKAPGDLAYLLAEAESLVALDRASEALALLQERTAQFSHNAAIYLAQGQILMRQNRAVEAVEMFRQAGILATEDLRIREHLALALYESAKYREAADVLARLLKDERYAKRTDLWLAAGECQMQTSRLREARSSFETAVQLDTGSVSAHLGLGKAALQLGDLRRAELALRKALALDTTSSNAHLLLGYLRLRQDRWSDALAEFQGASLLDPKDTVSLCMIGHVLEKMGKPQEAMRYYAKALQLKPEDDMASQMMASLDARE